MKTSNGYGPLDPDPTTEEEVPPGQIRDFLGELANFPADARVKADGQVEHMTLELFPDASGKACLLLDDQEIGCVLYASSTPDGLELVLSRCSTLQDKKVTVFN